MERRKVVALVLALAAGALVYVASGLLATPRTDTPPPKSSSGAANTPPPATDSHDEEPEAFAAQSIPRAVQSTAERFVVAYAALTACQSPEAALSRLEPVVTEGIYVELVESRPREGGTACLAPGGAFALRFQREKRGNWRVMAERSGEPTSQALYFELRHSGGRAAVHYLEDPRLQNSTPPADAV